MLVQIVTGIVIVINEPWRPELIDSTSAEFKELENRYIVAFIDSLARVDTREFSFKISVTIIELTTISITGFIRLENSSNR